MEKFLDALYKRLEAMEKTLAREKAKGHSTNITENAFKDEKTRMVPKILKKGATIDNIIKTLKAKGKLDEARALKKKAYELKNIAARIHSSGGGKTRRSKQRRGTRKNGF